MEGEGGAEGLIGHETFWRNMRLTVGCRAEPDVPPLPARVLLTHSRNRSGANPAVILAKSKLRDRRTINTFRRANAPVRLSRQSQSSMPPSQEREEALFRAAAELTPGASRRAFLDQACAEDPALRQ